MEDPSFDPVIAFGKVVGRFRLAVPDGPDFGSEPDAEPDSGRIRFDPLLPYQRALLPVPETVSNRTQIYDLDAQGYLVDKQGERGVWMLTGYYRVTFLLKKSRILPTTLHVTADHTDLEPLDLSIATPPSGAAVLTQSQYAELSHRIHVFEFPDHSDTANRDAADSHPMSAITGLLTALSDLGEAIGTGGSGGTVTATDAPTVPAEGASASYLVTSAVVWPPGLVWSTDPDGGTEPTITDAALVSLFTVDGTTYAVLGSTYPAPSAPDETGPTAGTLGVVLTSTTADGTVTGAADETELHATPYSFRIDAGTWSAWQAGATYEWTGLTASTEYDFQHRVRDAAGNITEGTVVTDSTDAPSADTTDPTPGTLAASAITDTSFTLTVSGASDETALHSQPYAFSTDNGVTYSAWQSSNVYNATGLTAETTYTCVHKVRDAATNEATGASITVDTTAASGSTWIDTFADGTGTAEPAGWTKRYTAPTNGTYTEEAGYLDIQRSGTGRSAITLDAANGTGDVDALIKARYVGAPGATFQDYFPGIIVGGSGGVASEDCIVAYARGGTTTPLRAGQYDAGAFTELGTGASGSIGNDAWYWLRVNYASGQFKARFWMDGAAEPSTWHIDVAADVKVGWVGIWDNCSEKWDYEVDYFSASTAGSAPAP